LGHKWAQDLGDFLNCSALWYLQARK